VKILISAYACEPGKSSESAVGWGWVLQAARRHDVWVLTRSANRPDILDYLARSPLPNVHWVYHDLPRWSRFWKRRRRGLHLYYYLWQASAYWVARRLHREVGFHAIHHATFVNYWMPSFLALLPVPFVLGPVGGAESAPAAFYRDLPLRARWFEHVRDLVRRAAELDPFVRAAARRSSIALGTTPETAAALERLGSRRVDVLSQVALDPAEFALLSALPIRMQAPFRLVSIGALLHLKGFALAMDAFAELRREEPTAEYWIIGDGPERRRLEQRARAHGVADGVHFFGHLPRHEVMTALGECDALLHPTLHDSGGFVCIEALAAGRPVVCLDLGGPAVIVAANCGFRVPADDPDRAPGALAAALRALAHDPSLRQRLGEAGRQRAAALFDWDRKGQVMDAYYALAAGMRTGSPRISA
jgi:glycosyltransferase involved in cell wall biosynthesis